MCNLFSNTMPVEAMRRLFDVEPARDRLGNAMPQPAIFPRGDAVIVRRAEDGAREMLYAHWGFLMPQTSKRTGQPILPKAVNNARDDKLRDSPFWRESFAQRRCLLPGTAFCEAQGRKPAVYHWFAMASEDPDDRPPFAFAGLWRRFRGRYRDELVDIDTCTMVTTTPNDLVRPVHPDRMPAILRPGDYATWLEGDADAAATLLRPFPAEAMRIAARGEDRKSDGARPEPAAPDGPAQERLL
jgi:putative SOS response-associated peptidase YedK